MNIAPLFTEFAVLFLFLFIVGAVISGCIVIVKRILKNGLKQARLNSVDIVILACGLIGFSCIFYGFTEPYQLDTTHITLSSRKLLPGSKLRILHISDLHCDGTRRIDDKLTQQIRAEKPDLIVFTGDAANNKKGLEQFKTLITDFATIAPVYAADGNHDTRGGAQGEDRYGGTGAHLLNCASTAVNVRGNLIWLAGVAVDSENCMSALLKAAPPATYSILLYHFPEGIREASQEKVDLFCTGHTHGGQVRLPFYGAIITMTSLGKKFESGLYREGGTYMYVTRGTGMTALPVRFLCTPELTVIDVVGSEK